MNDYINNAGKHCWTLGAFNLIGDPSLKVGGYGQCQQSYPESNLQINPSSNPQSSPSSQTQEQSTPAGIEGSSPTNR